MKVEVFDDPLELAQAAAQHAAQRIRAAIAERGTARILAGAGRAQDAFLQALTALGDVDWGEVELFHLEEFLGVSVHHPASRRKYLFDHLIHPARVGRYHMLDGEFDPERACRVTGAALTHAPIDVAFAGIGPGARLAFNAPPADFQTEKPYLIVRLDEACRREQVEEGWFADPRDVPEQGVSISLRQLMKATTIVCLAPDPGKTEAVKRSVEGAVSPLAPASLLQTHPDVTVYLGRTAAAGRPSC